MDTSTAGKLIGTGLGFGCIHVLTGADHLSALATLSVGSRLKAFSLGIRWGLGHSTGLVVVAAVLLGLKDKVDPHALERYCNWIVGVFMIGLGVWGVFKAVKHRRERQEQDAAAAAATARTQELATAAAAGDGDEGLGTGEHGLAPSVRIAIGGGAGGGGGGGSSIHMQAALGTASNTSSSEDASSSDERDEEEIARLPINSAGGLGGSGRGSLRRNSSSDGPLLMEEGSPPPHPLLPSSSSSSSAAAAARTRARGGDERQGDGEGDVGRGDGGGVGKTAATPTREPLIFLDEECEHADHAVLRFCRRRLHVVDIESPFVQRVVAFGIGIVHGIAGPGGVLGVLPAVQLHSWEKAALYLGTFCFASTLIMGIFAALYGELSARVGAARNIEFQMELFSASLSIIVGVLWIALIIAGKLNVVFG